MPENTYRRDDVTVLRKFSMFSFWIFFRLFIYVFFSVDSMESEIIAKEMILDFVVETFLIRWAVSETVKKRVYVAKYSAYLPIGIESLFKLINELF